MKTILSSTHDKSRERKDLNPALFISLTMPHRINRALVKRLRCTNEEPYCLPSCHSREWTTARLKVMLGFDWHYERQFKRPRLKSIYNMRSEFFFLSQWQEHTILVCLSLFLQNQSNMELLTSLIFPSRLENLLRTEANGYIVLVYFLSKFQFSCAVRPDRFKS